MTSVEAAASARMLAERRPPKLLYCPLRPHGVQLAFLWLDQFEAFFGGAAGPGKTYALLMAALQYADVPGYASLLLRRTFAELAMDGALMDIAHDWLGPTEARWNQAEHKWTFPSGATLQFGHMESAESYRRYQSAAFQFVGFDELTHFTKKQYTFMFSRCRRPADPSQTLQTNASGMSIANVPLRIRSASNPGGPGHEWVKTRFIDPDTRDEKAIVVRALLSDNRYLDKVSYVRGLEMIPGVERDRMLEGDWEATEAGNLFTVGNLVEVAESPPAIRSVRRWDLAASEPTPEYDDPDWTVGLRLELSAEGYMTITDCVAFRSNAGDVEHAVQATADRDGRGVDVLMPQDPGQAGKDQVAKYARILPGYVVESRPESGSKETRARPVAAAIDNGVVRLLKWCPHAELIKTQLRRFPAKGVHDDCVDALSGAYLALADGGPASVEMATGEIVRPWQSGGGGEYAEGAILRPWHVERGGGLS